MVETAFALHGMIQGSLPGMAERRMAKVVSERHGFGQILIDVQRTRHGPGDLRHFQAMGEPGAVMIALVINEYLRLVGQPAEGGGMQMRSRSRA